MESLIYCLEMECRNCCGEICQEEMLLSVVQRLPGRQVLALVQQGLQVGLLRDGMFLEAVLGTLYGAVACSLLGDIYLLAVDGVSVARCMGEFKYFVDCFSLLSDSQVPAKLVHWYTTAPLCELGMLYLEMPRLVDLREGPRYLNFLGCRLNMSNKLCRRKLSICCFSHQRWLCIRLNCFEQAKV